MIVLIPLWKRPEIVRITIKQWENNKVKPFFILSPEDRYFEELKEIIKGYNYIIFSNKRLGLKMNVGLQACLALESEWIMNLGSDDIIEKRYYQEIKPYFKYKMFGYNSCIVKDFYKGDKYLLKNNLAGYPIGGGRVIHRSLIENVFKQGLTVYDNDKCSGLDTNSQNNILKVNDIEVGVIESENPPIIDLKTSTNINTIFQIKHHLQKL